MDYALQLLIAILLGFYIGQWLDKKTGYGPWFTLLGIILGMILGMGVLYKRALQNQKALKAKMPKTKPHPTPESPEENEEEWP